MHVGVPKEIKIHEYRVGLTPPSVAELTAAGHRVTVETGAGSGIDFTDGDYVAAGATVVATAADVFAAADMIVKVKEPQLAECAMLRPGQVLFTYLHLAPDPEQAKALIASGATCIAYETVTDRTGGLPLLRPMSEVAGRMSVQVGAHYLEKEQGGRGILLGGIPGVPAAHVVILGGGVVGINAAKIASGMGANVTIMDVNLERLRYLDDVLPANVTTYFSNPLHIREILPSADVIIGAVLIKGARAPVLVSQADLKRMKPGSVIVDVAVDQGGCIETMHPTTHAVPVFTVDEVVHYGVANIPGAVPATSTYGLTNATFPYLLSLANEGVKQALRDDIGLAKGLNVADGVFFLSEVAEQFGLPLSTLDEWLA